MPTYWVPPPGSRNATFGGSSGTGGTAGTAARSASTASGTDDADTVRRCRSAGRSVRSAPATSSSRSPGRSSSRSASASACPRKAPEVRADSGRTSRRPSSEGRGGAGATGGASSRITCALVPPTPKALTAARRGWPGSCGHSSSVVGTRNGPEPKSISGFGRSKCRLGGIRRCSSARTALTSPAIPAAAPRCPMLVLTEPRAQ